MKLWLILARRCAEEEREFDDAKLSVDAEYNFTSESRNAHLVWNELWPPFERLVGLSEADAEIGDLTVRTFPPKWCKERELTF